ncbi:MAG: FISUMP domain-containing protein [Bacteroidales bacterium]|jgi:uncharacterized protein (TIGR02145 family)
MKLLIEHSVSCIAFFVVIFLAFFSCDQGNLPPSARLTAFPSVGDTSILFQFNARESNDDRDYPMGLKFRWDLNGDGNWDTDFANNYAITHQYTIPGTFEILVEVMDLDGLTSIATDSITVFGENRDLDTLTDTRDGNKYLIVKIKDRWWMAENLRFGFEIPTGRDQTYNDTIEYYREHNNRLHDTIGGVYSWLESLNYRVKESKGICPDGWHIPVAKEWEALVIPYPDSYAIRYYGKNGLSRLNLDLSNGGFIMDRSYYWSFESAHDRGFWSSSSKVEEDDYLPYHFGFSSSHPEIVHAYWGNGGLDRFYSVRCIRDN